MSECVSPLHESGSLQRDGEEMSLLFVCLFVLSYCSIDTSNICRGLERGEETVLGHLTGGKGESVGPGFM